MARLQDASSEKRASPDMAQQTSVIPPRFHIADIDLIEAFSVVETMAISDQAMLLR
jgi:hypothetical protein